MVNLLNSIYCVYQFMTESFEWKETLMLKLEVKFLKLWLLDVSIPTYRRVTHGILLLFYDSNSI